MKKAPTGLFANKRKANMPAATAAATPAAAGKQGPHPTPTGKRKYVRKKPLPNRKGAPGAAGQPPHAGAGAGGVPGGLSGAFPAGHPGVGPNAPGGVAGAGVGGVNGALGGPAGVPGAGGASGPKAKRAPVIKANPYYQPTIKVLMGAGGGIGGTQDGSSISSNRNAVQYAPIPAEFLHQAKTSTVANYCQSLLRISCMHVVQSSGYDSVQANPLKVMTDCLDRYLRLLADSVKQYAEHAGRAQVNALDVVDGLADLGIDLADLKEWTAENGGPITPAATIPAATTATNIKTEEGTATTTKGGETNTKAGTTTSESINTPSVPPLPSWKGPDPSLVLKDVLYKGRERDRDERDVYEWHVVPDTFVMPVTDEEQDAYAYPDNDSGDEDVEGGSTQRQQHSAPTADASKPTRRKGPQWDPHIQPEYIPDHLPPFPGAVLPGSDKSYADAEEPSDDDDDGMAVAVQTQRGSDSQGEVVEKTDVQQGQDASNNNDANVAGSSENKHTMNPYTHVVPFSESTLPFSPLYAAIPSTPVVGTGGSSSVSGSLLSDRGRQLFQETLSSLSDSTAQSSSSMAQARRKNSRLANSVSRSLDQQADTLFSSASQNTGMIDSVLKNSAPLMVMNKFANLGISVQDVLSSSPLTNNIEFPLAPLDPNLATSIVSSSSSPATAVGQAAGSSGRGGVGMLRKNSTSLSSSPLSIVTNAPTRDEIPAPMPPQRRKSSLASVTASDPTAVGSSSSLEGYSTSQETVVPVVPLSRRSSHSKTSFDRSNSQYKISSPMSPTGIVKVEKEEPSFSSALSSASSVPVPSHPASLGTAQSASSVVPSAPKTVVVAPAPTGPIMSLSSLPTTYGMSERITSSSPSILTASSSSAATGSSSRDSSKLQQPQQPLQSPTSTTGAAPKIRFKFSALESLTSDLDDGGSHASSPSSTHKKERKHHHPKHPKHSRDDYYDREGSVESSMSSSSKHSKKKRRSDYDSDGGAGGSSAWAGEFDDYSREKKKKKKKHKSKERDYDRDDRHHRDRDSDRDRSERDRDRGSHRHHRDNEPLASKSNGSSSSYSHRKTSSTSTLAHGASTPVGHTVPLAKPAAIAQPTATAAPVTDAGAPLLPQYLPGQQQALRDQYRTMVLAGHKDPSIQCVCLNPNLDDGLFMVCCDSCDNWFHGHCVDVKKVDLEAKWFCPRCRPPSRA